MPAYVIKVIDEDGWLRPPVVANCKDESAAHKLVRSLVPDGASIVIKGIRPDVMAGTFGNMPEGAAVFRDDWVWSEKSDEPTPL
jgi:hypothetical protein